VVSYFVFAGALRCVGDATSWVTVCE